ncbi:MAG TPA: putative DNA binding domain-containing protein [Candidatus Paceibacterota bacterium]|nr:putative DNA binding domain-containing protein [Verrucomicrobiota bacterium]HRY47490.1 putative DNA binding domain-containing protein [Candidatus Paceibacterota bacterium]
METIELIEIIGRGEDSRTQFKREPIGAKNLAEEMVAFSNGMGGAILFGVDDDGQVTGLTNEDVRAINGQLSDAANDKVRPSIYPKTEIHRVGEDNRLVLAVLISEGVSKPYSDKSGAYWIKSGADKRRITAREEIQQMLQASLLIHADELPVDGTTTGDLDTDHLGEFFVRRYEQSLDAVLEKDGITTGQLLNNLGLAREGSLNLAGLLVFGRNPQRYRPACVVKGVSFVGNDPAGDKYRDSEDIAGCLRDMHKGTMSFLTRNLRRLQGEKGFNTEGDIEIPVAALEELVVNMLLHRDYFISAPWKVMIFDNRVELISPGMLPNNLTVENIRNGVSVIRNPLIASFATKELPYRGIGTGIRRALAAVPDLQLESNQGDNLFTARIPRKAE